MRTRFVAALLLLLPAVQVLAMPRINEFLAENDRLVTDQDDNSPDWIEIYHPGPGDLDLGGYYLSDRTNLTLWAFATGTVMQADSYLLVFASGKDRRDPTNELHTSFSLENSGESVYLTEPNGTNVVSAFTNFPNQTRNISYGWLPGDTETGYFETPTPGAPNNPGVIDFVKDTKFSHSRGFYTGAFVLTITSATPNATIRYTLDGTKPSPTFGIVYGSGVPITQTTTLRAMAYRAGWKPTNIDAQTYVIPSDVINQSNMDPDITTAPRYAPQMDAALRALPVVSLQFTNADLFGANGIYDNPNDSGDLSEREVHIEYFDPANTNESFHIEGGVRIHGGNARRHPKKSLRLYFRSEYGNNRLNHDLYPDSPVKSFKRLLLRAGGHDAWTFRRTWNEPTYIRNEFLHRLQLAMGQPSPHGKLVHVYLNGDYWGFYNLQELPHADFHADHHGGDKLDWDVIKHGADPEDGDLAAWNTLMNRTDAPITSAAAYADVEEYVNVDNFIDAMIQRIWSSDEDWLGPIFRDGNDIGTFVNKNWYAARKSRNGTQPFRFYNWDAEMSMGIPFLGERTFENDLTRVDDRNSPGQVYDALRAYPAFRVRFGDRLHQHFFDDGTFTVAKLQQVWTNLANRAELPVIAESARWGTRYWNDGGNGRPSPNTKDDHWVPAKNWVQDTYLVNRSSTVLDQFKAIDMYPNVDAPTFDQSSGRYTNTFALTMTAPTGTAGTVYFTRDGSDPLIPADPEPPVAYIGESATVRALVPSFGNGGTTLGNSWWSTNDPPNIANWKSGPNGVGYEDSPADYAGLVRTDVSEMRSANGSCFIRIPFTITDTNALSNLSSLTLDMRYDDGYVAYINGSLVAQRNQPLTGLSWNALSARSHSDRDAVNYEPADISNHIDKLVPGANMLAIHGLNRATTSSDFLIMAKLSGIPSSGNNDDINTNAVAYASPTDIATSETIKARFRSDAGEWSALQEGRYVIGQAANSNRLALTEIMYHPDNAFTAAELAVATAASDFEYLEMMNISTQAVDLTRCYFSQGITFTFPDGYFLLPGERCLVVNNRTAFIARYGGQYTHRIAGEFQNETKLDDGGERLTLVDENDIPIFSVRYRDADGWPEVADGPGNSLVQIDPTHGFNPDDALFWRASFSADGRPGSTDREDFDSWKSRQFNRDQLGDSGVSGTLAIPPGEVLNNLVRYTFATDLTLRMAPEITPFVTNGMLAVRYRTRSVAPDVQVVPRVTTDLLDWHQGNPPPVMQSDEDEGDGTRTRVIMDPDPADRKYLRLDVEYAPGS